MKRIFISLLALLLALSMLFVGCNEEPPVNNDPNNNGGGSTQTPPAGTSFTQTENYLPSEFATQMKTYFESGESGFTFYDDRVNAPLVCSDVFAISNAVVKSITIPVFSTGKTDSEGNFTFSLYVLSNDWATLRTELKEAPDPIVIKVNAEEQGLEANKIGVRKFVKVDLSDYNLKLTDKQTLGFSSPEDTLIPARVMTKGYVTTNNGKEKYVPAKYLIDNWDVVGYYYYNVAGEAFEYTDNTLLYDFEFERTYESEAAYNAMIAAKAQADADYAMKIAALKEVYNGKTISVMGDSISTFNSITNDPLLGLGDNPIYSQYTVGASVYTYERTYWGKLAAETGMSLNVINSWGGGKVYGWDKVVNEKTGESYKFNDCMLRRSYNLSKGSLTPDLILLNYGINDMSGSYSSIQDTSSSRFSGKMTAGDLYQRLTAADKTKTDKEIVAEWFAEVQAYAAQGGYNPDDPSTITFFKTDNSSAGISNIYTCWEAAYALSLQNIKRLYPNAEIVCITLPDRNHTSSTQPRLSKANLLITALAEYFEAGLVNQDNSGVTRQNCIMYASDATGLHPNGKGHAALTRAIVDVLYEKHCK